MTRAGFCSWAGQFESYLVANSQIQVFSWQGLIYWPVMRRSKYEPCHEKASLGVSTWYDSNRPAQLQRLARVLKFRLKQVEVLYYLGSKQQRCWCAGWSTSLLLAYGINRFSHDVAHMIKVCTACLSICIFWTHYFMVKLHHFMVKPHFSNLKKNYSIFSDVPSFLAFLWYLPPS